MKKSNFVCYNYFKMYFCYFFKGIGIYMYMHMLTSCISVASYNAIPVAVHVVSL